MDKIYSRKRIRFPKALLNKNKKFYKVILIFFIAIITSFSIIKSIEPIFDKLCIEEARSVATIVTNEESTKVIQKYKYEDLITITKDADNNITMIQSNMVPINLITSDVAENIQKRLKNEENNKIKLKLGAISASKFLSGIGPEIPISVHVIGNVDTKVESKFENAGINQTIHKIYLQVNCRVGVLTPYTNINESIENQVLIAENIIVGQIPSTYYNIEGLQTESLTDILE